MYNVALLIMLVFTFEIFRISWDDKRNALLKYPYGLLLGFIGIIVMLTHWEMDEGAFFDTRSILLSLSGLFFGFVPTVIAMATTILFRFYQGGVGALTGATVILASGTIGLIWRHIIKKNLETYSFRDFWVLGMVVHVVMILLMLTFPQPLKIQVLKSVTLPVLTLYPLGFAMLGILMRNRLKQDSLVNKIKEDERILKVVSDHSTNWEYWIGPDQRFIYCSDSCLQITGYDRQSFLDDPALLHSIIYPGDSEMFSRHKHRADEQISEQVVFRIIHKDGSIRWISHSCLPIFDDDGSFIGTRGSNSEITRMKEIEQEILESREEIRQLLETAEKSRQVLLSVIEDQKESQAELSALNESLEQKIQERTAQLTAANRELEAFSYSVSHDLRAPLRGINGFVDILTEDYGSQLDDEGKRICRIIKQNAQRMGQLIDDLLAFSRITRQEIVQSKIDMAGLVQAVYDELADPASKEKTSFLMEPLPDCFGDPSLIRQVVINLISNAIKYSSNCEKPVIEVTSKMEDGQVFYHFRDNGVGFDEQYKDKLFGVFQRLHNEREFPGTGVGLAIVHRIITRHNGRVGAESSAGKGAGFWFSLPRHNIDF